MYTRLIELSAGITGTILNLCLIPLIITKSSPKMGRYKYLLLAYTIVACYFSFSVSTGLYVSYSSGNLSHPFRHGFSRKAASCL